MVHRLLLLCHDWNESGSNSVNSYNERYSGEETKQSENQETTNKNAKIRVKIR